MAVIARGAHFHAMVPAIMFGRHITQGVGVANFARDLFARLQQRSRRTRQKSSAPGGFREGLEDAGIGVGIDGVEQANRVDGDARAA